MGKLVETSSKICLNCLSPFFRKRRKSGRLENIEEWLKKKFCKHKCYSDYNIGIKNCAWKGGRCVSPQGYIRISVGKKVRAYEHRLVVEKSLGRKLKHDEHIHHIDGNKTNNSLSNLKVLTNEEHRKEHMKTQSRVNGRFSNV